MQTFTFDHFRSFNVCIYFSDLTASMIIAGLHLINVGLELQVPFHCLGSLLV